MSGGLSPGIPPPHFAKIPRAQDISKYIFEFSDGGKIIDTSIAIDQATWSPDMSKSPSKSE